MTAQFTDQFTGRMAARTLKGMNQRDFVYDGLATSTNVMDALGVEHRGDHDRLPVTIKRAGTSETLSMAARRRNGWREIRGLDALGDFLNPPAPPIKRRA
jgi:hypothetical protein